MKILIALAVLVSFNVQSHELEGTYYSVEQHKVMAYSCFAVPEFREKAADFMVEKDDVSLGYARRSVDAACDWSLEALKEHR